MSVYRLEWVKLIAPPWLRLQHVTAGSRDCPGSALQPTPTLSG